MAAHRYWRIYVTSTPGSDGYTEIAEVTMATSVGGANVIGSGTASSLDYYVGSDPTYNVPAKACDGNASTFWLSNGDMPSWWAYDFGAGNAFDIQEVKITAGPDTNGRQPGVWQLQYSDDGSSFTTLASFTSGTWSAGSTQTFDAPPYVPPGAGQHRYWRININSNAQQANGCLAEVTMATSVGGANVLGSGTPTAQSTYTSTGGHGAGAACDGNAATWWNAGEGTGLPVWWQYDFGYNTYFDIAEVKITCRPDDTTTSPVYWDLQYSDDGTTFTTLYTFQASAWTEGETQTFNASNALPPPPSPPAGSHRYWRINVTGNAAGANACLADVAMAASPGGANLVSGGAPSASSSYGGYPPSAACDRNGSTWWNAAEGTGLPQWWQYDFGYRNYVSVAEVKITGRGDDTTSSPTSWDLQYSDDGTTFTTLQSFTSTPWSEGQTQVFEYSGYSVLTHPFVMVLA